MTYGAEAAGSGIDIGNAVIAAADVCLFSREVYNVGLWFL
jgi:hypothetical protein